MKKKKLWKSLSACILAGCMVIGCLTGCAGSDGGAGSSQNGSSPEKSSDALEQETGSQASESSEEEVKEIAELSYWCALDANTQATLVSFNDMEMLNNAQEIVGVNITYTHPAAGTETEQFNLKLSGLDLEDIMESSWGAYPGGPSQAIADGIIIDLAPYLEQGYAPNFKKILDEYPHIAQQITTDKGEIYAFPAIGIDAVEVTCGYIVREGLLPERRQGAVWLHGR